MFDDLLTDIDSLAGDRATKERVIDLMLTQYAGMRIHISTMAARRRARDALIYQLRRAGYPMRDQVRVLVARLNVSRSTAWEWVRDADTTV